MDHITAGGQSASAEPDHPELNGTLLDDRGLDDRGLDAALARAIRTLIAVATEPGTGTTRRAQPGTAPAAA
jgi:hypothetical protein